MIRTSQPAIPAPINWGNQFARGMVFFHSPIHGARNIANGSDLVASGAPGKATGSSKVATSLSGSKGYQVGADPRFDVTAGFTIGVWYRLASVPVAGYQLLSKDKDTGGRAYTFDINSYSNQGVRLYLNGGSALVIESRAPVAGDERFAIGTCDPSGNLVLYIDGVLVGSAAAAAIPTATANLTLGYREYSGSNEYFDGFIYQAFLSSRVWSAAEVRAYSRNPWQLFAPTPTIGAREYASSSNVTTALTGASATFSAGNLLDAGSGSLSGQAASFSGGSLGTWNVTIGLSGQSATTAAGTLAPGVSQAVTGQSATFAAGTVTPGVTQDVTTALTGASAAFASGTIVASGGHVVVTGETPAGGRVRHRREQYIVKVDGQEFVCQSMAHVYALMDKAREAAKLFSVKEAEKAAARSAQTSRLELPKFESPKIEVSSSDLMPLIVSVKKDIDATYSQALIDIELRILFEIDAKDKDNEEAILLLM